MSRWLLALCLLTAPALADSGFHPRLGFGLDSGSITNAAVPGRQAAMVGGFDLNVCVPVTSRFALAFAWVIDFEYKTFKIPLQSLALSAHYYLLGEPGWRVDEGAEIESRRRPTFSLYLGAGLARDAFYLGGHPNTATEIASTGSAASMHAMLGLNQRLSTNLDLNLELNHALTSFAESDDRVRLKSTLLRVGISYLW